MKPDKLDELFYAGRVPPECYDELTDGRDLQHDDERNGELHQDKPEHERHQDVAD